MEGKQRASAADELLNDRSLWQLYGATWNASFPWKSIVPSAAIAVLLGAFLYSFSPLTGDVASLVYSVSDAGFQFGVAMLAFLVAGFTIFATTTKPAVFVRMLSATHKDTGYTWLRWTFLLFMHVFAHFIAFLFLVLIIKIFGTRNGPLDAVLSVLSDQFPRLKWGVASTALLAVCWWLVYLLVLVGDFVFNVYQACATMIACEDEDLS